jgi:hypothetical protein
MPGPSRPDGEAARVSSAPSFVASAFILPSATSTPPSFVAKAWATSLPECISRPCSSWSTVYCPPSTMPTQVHSWSASSLVGTTISAGLSSVTTTSASSVLMSEAGRCREWGSFAASTLPVSRSCSTQEAAVVPSGGFSASAGSTVPHSAIRGPPTGSTGTGSGEGLGIPGAGFSEVSTGGGGTLRAAHVAAAAFGAVTGSAAATAGNAARANEPDRRNGTSTRSDRRIALCTH